MAGGEGGSAAQRAGRAGEGGTAVLAKLRPTRPCGADGGGGARKGGKFSKFCFFRFLQKSMRRVLPTRPHRMCAHPGAGAPLPVESAGRERGVVRRSSPRVDSTPKLSSFSKTPLKRVRLKGGPPKVGLSLLKMKGPPFCSPRSCNTRTETPRRRPRDVRFHAEGCVPAVPHAEYVGLPGSFPQKSF